MFFRKRPEEVKTCERHVFVLDHKEEYCVNAMCRVLKISESGYYRWLKNRNKPTARELLSVEIQAILDEHPDNDNYGVKRMNVALEQKGIHVSPRTVYRTMSESVNSGAFINLISAATKYLEPSLCRG